MVDQRLLHLGREDVGAAGDDHVDAAVGDVQEAVVVDVAQVADGPKTVRGLAQLRGLTEVVRAAVGRGAQEDLAELAGGHVGCRHGPRILTSVPRMPRPTLP